MNSSTPARNLSAVFDHTKRMAGHYIELHPELEAALSAYAKREGIRTETAIAEAVRAYLGIEDGVIA